MPKPTFYQPHIDGLRAIAVLSVVAYHYQLPGFEGGYIGVDVFFVISGYLISNLILTEINGTGNFGFAKFYARRIRRLFPALILTLAASLVCATLLFSPEQFEDFGRSLAAAAFSVSNILFWQESGYFDPHAHLRPLLHTWSLAVEEQFYLFWPALLWLLTRRNSGAKQFAALAVVGLLSMALNYLWVHGTVSREFSATIFYLTPFRMFELAIGGLAVFSHRLPCHSRWAHDIAMALGLALIGLSVVSYNDKMIFPYWPALIPCVGALLLIISRDTRLLGGLLTNKLAVGFGLISYSLYLAHWPVLVFYKHYKYEALQPEELFGLFGLSVVLSVLMYKYIEQPFRKKPSSTSNGFSQKIFISSSIGAMALVGLAGIYIAGSGGETWNNNKSLSVQALEQARQKRYDLVRAGCSLLRLGQAKYCNKNKPKQILIIGNSHEPDGYNIFSEVYRNNPQISLVSFGTLNGCNVTLDQGTPLSVVEKSRCSERIALLANKEFLINLDGVIFSSNRPFDKNKKSAWGILTYIESVNPTLPIAVLGGYLNTTCRCSDLHHRFGSFDACKKPENLSYNPFGELSTSEVEASRSLDYLYIDKTRLLCKNGTLQSCAITAAGEPAFYDWHHLSKSFTEHLGKRIVQVYAKELEKQGFPAITPPR